MYLFHYPIRKVHKLVIPAQGSSNLNPNFATLGRHTQIATLAHLAEERQPCIIFNIPNFQSPFAKVNHCCYHLHTNTISTASNYLFTPPWLTIQQECRPSPQNHHAPYPTCHTGDVDI
ncbi:hypothetical protein M758_8G067200 [Ceratodon purpureus]|nr:hypothetical protein M758_8G067200 [Ceratodon purpureus]